MPPVIPEPTQEELDERVLNALIKSKMKEQAITALKDEGKLDKEGKLTAEGKAATATIGGKS